MFANCLFSYYHYLQSRTFCLGRNAFKCIDNRNQINRQKLFNCLNEFASIYYLTVVYLRTIQTQLMNDWKPNFSSFLKLFNSNWNVISFLFFNGISSNKWLFLGDSNFSLLTGINNKPERKTRAQLGIVLN